MAMKAPSKEDRVTVELSTKPLNVDVDFLLVDGNKFKPYCDKNNEIISHKCIVGGDSKYVCVEQVSEHSAQKMLQYLNYLKQLLKLY